MLVVVGYDIADERRRLHISATLKNFGERIQRSLFECHLSEAQFLALQRRIEQIVVPAEDRVRYYRLCARDKDQIEVDGLGEVTQDWDYRIV